MFIPAIEMVEEWGLRRSAEKDLAQMRMHAASGHRWDVTRGQWVAWREFLPPLITLEDANARS
jgi:hypothetical protein